MEEDKRSAVPRRSLTRRMRAPDAVGTLLGLSVWTTYGGVVRAAVPDAPTVLKDFGEEVTWTALPCFRAGLHHVRGPSLLPPHLRKGVAAEGFLEVSWS